MNDGTGQDNPVPSCVSTLSTFFMMQHLYANEDAPVIVYYCKAGIPTGQTIRITQEAQTFQTSAVSLADCDATMHHDNATARAKRSGARCTLIITSGTITFPT